MRRPLRLVDPSHGLVDLDVEPAPEATVGDLADALAQSIGRPTGDTVVSRWPADRRGVPPSRGAPLRTHGPRAGSTVELVRQAGVSPDARPAPVRLVAAGGQVVQLSYGVTPLAEILIEVDHHVEVRTTGGADTRIGGSPVLGAERVSDGDLVSVAGAVWTVCIDGALDPPPPDGWVVPHLRRPRAIVDAEPEQISAPAAPEAVRAPGFPVLSATVPLLLALGLWVVTRSLLSAGFMLFSVVFVVASGLEARREARAEDRARVADFRERLVETLDRLDRAAAAQRRRHELCGLDPQQLSDVVGSEGAVGGQRIWEREEGRGPIATVRLGTAVRPLEAQVQVPDSGRRELRDELRDAVAGHLHVADVVTLDLALTGGLVIEGADESAAAVARSLVLQLSTLVGPDHLSVQVIAPRDRVAAWHDLRWLPHCAAGPRRPWSLTLADGVDAASPGTHRDRRNPERSLLVWVTTVGGVRPDDIGAVLSLEGGAASLRVDLDGVPTSVITDLTPEPLHRDESEPVARMLAGLVPTTTPRWRPTADETTSDDFLTDAIGLSDVTADPDLIADAEQVAARWQDSDTTRHLATPVGMDRVGGVINLDLCRDGPHALVAGTTGSGKSELLRTYLVSLALHHSPERVQLLLVDYKGGAAFGPLDRLPHTAGSITDLSGPLAERALVSLRAELRRREALLAVDGSDEWRGAALVIVVDELATLAAERPDFVEGLVDVAQRGRSLGLHLLLATQRPAGVITDSIRANVTMRLALRVADEDDSRDVVDTAAAAHLPREVPGRAVVRLGPTRVTAVQFAYTGAAFGARPRVRLTPWRCRSAPEPAPPGVRSDLDVALATIEAAARRANLAPVRRSWLEPLPDRLDRADLPDPPRPGSVVLGLVDRPDHQAREPLVVDLARDGGVVVLGASGAGCSTALRTLAAAVDAAPGERWHVHVIDGNGSLSDLAALASVGDVIALHDVERVLRLLRGTASILDRAAAGDADELGAPRRVIVVDGIAAFEERYERIDRGEGTDLLARIARDGRSAKVHVVVTARRRAEVPLGLMGALSSRIVLRCSTEDEAALLGLDDSAAAQDLPPGRCRVGGHVAQLAVAGPAGVGTSGAAPVDGAAPAVPRLPRRLLADELPSATSDPWCIAIGLDADSWTTATLDLGRHHAIVAGPSQSGVSSTLASIVAAHPAAMLLGRGDRVALACTRAVERAADGRAMLLAVDDLPDLLDGPDGDDVDAALRLVLRQARELPLRLVLGGEVDALSRCFHDAVTIARRGRTGLLLGGDPELHGALWHATLARRTDLPPAPGRGWLLTPSGARRVQVALREAKGADPGHGPRGIDEAPKPGSG